MNKLLLTTTLSSLLLLQACGGGGGSEGESAGTTPPEDPPESTPIDSGPAGGTPPVVDDEPDDPAPNNLDIAYWSSVDEARRLGTFNDPDSIYATYPVVSNCDGGVSRTEAQQRALEAVNKIRELHLLPRVEYDSTFNPQMQETGLVMRANNDEAVARSTGEVYLTHFPEEDDACYSEMAYDGARTSNIAAAFTIQDPVQEMIRYMDDSNNQSMVEAAGHRRWLQNPYLGHVSYGQVGGFSAIKVFEINRGLPEMPDPDVDYVAFPFGDYPYFFVTDSAGAYTPWSIFLTTGDENFDTTNTFDYWEDAVVEVVNEETGEQMEVSREYSDTQWIGVRNFLSWRVADWEYDTQYRVNITNIKNSAGAVFEVSYPVYLEYADIVFLEDPLESNDQETAMGAEGLFESDADRDAYTMDLTGVNEIVGISEYSNQAFFISVYGPNKHLIVESDEAIQGPFFAGEHQVIVSRCANDGTCYQSTSGYELRLQ